MRSPICDMLGIEFPLLAFSHCRAGGFGVFGAVSLPPDRLEEELRWIDAHVGGKPYGVDLIVSNKIVNKGQTFDAGALLDAVPTEHKTYAAQILARYDIDSSDLDDAR